MINDSWYRVVDSPDNWQQVPSDGANDPAAVALRSLAAAYGYHDHMRLAGQAGLPANVVRGLMQGKTRMTADFAERLAPALNTTPERLLGSQTRSDIERVREARLRDLEPDDAPAIRPLRFRGPRR